MKQILFISSILLCSCGVNQSAKKEFKLNQEQTEREMVWAEEIRMALVTNLGSGGNVYVKSAELFLTSFDSDNYLVKTQIPSIPVDNYPHGQTVVFWLYQKMKPITMGEGEVSIIQSKEGENQKLRVRFSYIKYIDGAKFSQARSGSEVKKRLGITKIDDLENFSIALD